MFHRSPSFLFQVKMCSYCYIHHHATSCLFVSYQPSSLIVILREYSSYTSCHLILPCHRCHSHTLANCFCRCFLPHPAAYLIMPLFTSSCTTSSCCKLFPLTPSHVSPCYLKCFIILPYESSHHIWLLYTRSHLLTVESSWTSCLFV